MKYFYRRQNRLDLTLKLYEDLHQRNPDFQNLNLALASTYIQLGRYKEATIALEESVSKNPQQLDPLKTLGSLYFQQKEWMKAAAVYDKIVTFFPESHDMHQFKIQALVAAGKQEEACNELKDYLASYPDDAIAKNQYQTLQKIIKK